MKISGIYTVYNKISNKYYIGYSKDILGRLAGHKCDLLKNKHKNIHLQRAFNIDGLYNFEFDILEECEEIFLCCQEHYWCLLLNTHNDKFGYNIKPTHPHDKNKKQAESTKIKMSKLKKGYPPHINCIKRSVELRTGTKKTKAFCDHQSKLIKNRYPDGNYPFISKESRLKQKLNSQKAINQYDLFGNLIAEWECINDASREYNIGKHSIIACLKGRNKTGHGYIWKYKI